MEHSLWTHAGTTMSPLMLICNIIIVFFVLYIRKKWINEALSHLSQVIWLECSRVTFENQTVEMGLDTIEGISLPVGFVKNPGLGAPLPQWGPSTEKNAWEWCYSGLKCLRYRVLDGSQKSWPFWPETIFLRRKITTPLNFY